MRMLKRLFIMSLAIGCVTAQAAPEDDLSSPSPEARANAAKIIQEQHLYKPAPRAPWDKLAASIKAGDSGKSVLERIQKAQIDAGATSSYSADVIASITFPDKRRISNMGFILDDSWKLQCFFKGDSVIECKVVEEPRDIFVWPPENFTGKWTTYRVNGESVVHYYSHGHSAGSYQ
jgi:hypothetical protein